MPKKWELTVESWPELITGQAYRLRVVDIEKAAAKNKGLVATLEHLDSRQLGRKCRVTLPLPVYDRGHPTADFFLACGVSVNVNQRIVPKDTIGSVIKVIFGSAAAGGELIPVEFKPILKENENAQQSQPANQP